MRVFLARHGVTDWNNEGRMQGHARTSLNRDGRKQGRQLAYDMIYQKPLGVEVDLVTSDLPRAVETAEFMMPLMNLVLSPDRRLRECSFGALEGLTEAEILERHGPATVEQADNLLGDYDFTAFGGENRSQVLVRQLAVLAELKVAGKGNVIVVGHGRSLRTLLAGLGHHAKSQQGIRNGAYVTIEY